MACLKRQLWGKAHQLLSQAVLGLKDAGLQRRAWRALAQLAEERGDAVAAQQAYKRLLVQGVVLNDEDKGRLVHAFNYA
jgi:HemY protein